MFIPCWGTNKHKRWNQPPPKTSGTAPVLGTKCKQR